MEIDQHQLYSEDKILAIRTDGGLKAYLVDRVSHESQLPHMIESGLCSELTTRQKTQTGKIDLITWNVGKETVLAVFSAPHDEFYAYTVVIHYSDLLTFAKGTVEGWVLDRPDESGNHVQTEVKTDAKEWLRENIGEAIKEYLETGNKFYQL
jgi:hypothetical protein